MQHSLQTDDEPSSLNNNFYFERTSILVSVVLFHLIAALLLSYTTWVQPLPKNNKKLLVQTVQLKKERIIAKTIKNTSQQDSIEPAYLSHTERNKEKDIQIDSTLLPHIEDTAVNAPPKKDIVSAKIQKKDSSRQQNKKTIKQIQKKEPTTQKKVRSDNTTISSKKAQNDLKEVFSSLDRAKKRNTTVASSTIQPTQVLQSVGVLASDTEIVVEGQDKETPYIVELIARLKSGIKLPDIGTIKLELTISSTGKVVRYHILSSTSEKNKKIIEKNIQKVHFSPFGVHFKNEQEHIFRIQILCD